MAPVAISYKKTDLFQNCVKCSSSAFLHFIARYRLCFFRHSYCHSG